MLAVSTRVGKKHMNLSKAYNCIPYDLLIALLEAYKFDKVALKFALDYISRKKRDKEGFADSVWMKILGGSPQDFVSHII